MLELSKYLADLPKLHSWDGGKTWNSGGFSREFFNKLHPFVEMEFKNGGSFVETGAGNSTIYFLLQNPARVVSIDQNKAIHDRIRDFCEKSGIPTTPLTTHVGSSHWILPDVARKEAPTFDFALIDGCHGWPAVFVDFCYMNHLVRAGGLIMIDDTQLYSVHELVRLLHEQPGYAAVLDFGKTIVFRKIADTKELINWDYQPYIVRRGGTPSS